MHNRDKQPWTALWRTGISEWTRIFIRNLACMRVSKLISYTVLRFKSWNKTFNEWYNIFGSWRGARFVGIKFPQLFIKNYWECNISDMFQILLKVMDSWRCYNILTSRKHNFSTGVNQSLLSSYWEWQTGRRLYIHVHRPPKVWHHLG